MNWERWTTRSLMALVLGLGLLLGLGKPALEAARDHGFHAHVWIERTNVPRADQGRKFLFTNKIDLAAEVPFLARYWRRLRGLIGHGRLPCQPGRNQVRLLCEYDHPEICYRGPRIVSVSVPLEIQELRNRMDDELRGR